MRFTYARFAPLLLVLAVTALPAHGQGGCCVLPDNGNGTVDMISGCPYFGCLLIDEGIPNGAILVEAELTDFFDRIEIPGGLLGGSVVNFSGFLQMTMDGDGILAGFQRTIFMAVTGEAHFGPRIAGNPIQGFPNDMFLLQGEVFGDPDFDILRIQGGSGFGLPSPGNTTLTRLGPPGQPFSVDSFFDIEYRIEFQGAPGSVLEGFGGITNGQCRYDHCVVATSVPATPDCCTNWSEVKKMFR